MTSRTTGVSKSQKSRNYEGEGPSWILIAGGALLSTLSVRLGYKLKQAVDTRQPKISNSSLRGNGISADRRKSGSCHLHSNMHSFAHDEDSRFNCITVGNGGVAEIKRPHDDQMLIESDATLPLVTIPTPDFNRDNGTVWTSSPDRLELPPKPFHHSNCSDSPCVSEPGSDIFSKREVIQKLRQQLKRRDDMILEMQDQIEELQDSVNSQLAHCSHLQSQLDATNRDLGNSEREIQRLRKAMADHCVGIKDKPSKVTVWATESRNGRANLSVDGKNDSDSREEGKGDGKRIEMLKREVGELKEVIDGKEYLLQSYKEQKAELSMKIKDMQQRLDSQLPNIL